MRDVCVSVCVYTFYRLDWRRINIRIRSDEVEVEGIGGELVKRLEYDMEDEENVFDEVG